MARKLTQIGEPLGARIASCISFIFFEALLPLVPTFLFICKNKVASRELLLVTAVMSVVGLVNTLKNSGGLLIAFLSLLGVLSACYLQDPNCPNSVTLKTLDDALSAATNTANLEPCASLWLIGAVVCYTVVLSIKYHCEKISKPHWALPALKMIFAPAKDEENNV